MSSPGVNFIMGFSDVNNPISKTEPYQRYVEYMDRPEAVTNPKEKDHKESSKVKSSRLFTANKDTLTKDEKEQIKNDFKTAYDKNMAMWTPIISFNNDWLAKNGFYNKATGNVDEKGFREFTRLAMKEFLKRENMEMSATWTAAIHYNTDNIHVHLAITEPNPTRKKIKVQLRDGRIYETHKARIKGETIKSFKSKIANNILEKTLNPINQKLDKIMKQDILKNRNQDLFLNDNKLKNMFMEIYSNLPEDKNKWNYSTLSKDPKMKVLIDKLSKNYINDYHNRDFKNFQNVLKAKNNEYNQAYGTKSNFVYDNTINELYKRMGNSVLSECKKYDKCINQNNDVIKNSVGRLKKSLKKDYDTEKNKHEFEKLKQQIEYEKSL